MSTGREFGFADARVVQALDVDALTPGRIHRLEVDLVTDDLGRQTRLPMLVARGHKPGPVFGLTAGIHGNEINGIPVIHRLMDKLELTRLKGTVAAVVVVNTPGFLRHQREFRDGTDLNHIFPGREPGNESQVFVHRFLRRIVSGFDFLLDLHTASFGRVNSLYVRADMTNAQTARMAYLQRPQIIVHNPASDYTLRGAAMDAGIPAITVEIGNPQRFQKDFIKSSLVGVRAVLGDLGLTPKRKLALGAPPVICKQSGWMYTDHGGLLEVYPSVADRVTGGDVVARLHNIFGDVVEEHRAPHDGIVIGKSVNPVGGAGARILHLGVPAPDGGRHFLDWESVSGRHAAPPK
ncbi:MAG: succinylglutamate desuccinylase/aspartoacylase family protein [Planctomycetota bacterium]|jgi:predicted deacylase